MDIAAPPTPRPKKRRSAWRCGLFLCSAFGIIIFCGIGYFAVKGVREVVQVMRHPHKHLYGNGTQADDVGPLISRGEKFDVYFSVWVRRPDRLQPPMPEEHRFTEDMDRMKSMTWMPLEHIVLDPDEDNVFAERVASGVTMKDQGFHKDVEFELPLEHFYDRSIYGLDIRCAEVSNFTDWRPSGAEPLRRMPEEVLQSLDLSALQQQALERMSISYSLVKLRKPHRDANSTEPEPEDLDPAARDRESAWMDKHVGPASSAQRKNLDHQWETRTKWDPFIYTRSHVYLVDQTRHFNRSSFDEKHQALRNRSCGLAQGLPPSRWLCNRDYIGSGHWETRLELEDGSVAYGPHMNTPKQMAGPADLMKLPVTRGRAFDKSTDANSVTVRHSFTFSILSPLRIGMLNEYNDATDLPQNATAAQIAQAHDGWVQGSGMLGNRIEGARPWRRILMAFVGDFVLGIPAAFLVLLYWYTRLTSAGINSFATIAIAFSSVGQQVEENYIDKPTSPFMWFLALLSGGVETLQSALMLLVVLPFELQRTGWKVDIKRVTPSKRERDTRRVEGRIPWSTRGIIFLGCLVWFGLCIHFDILILQPRHWIPPSDTPPSTISKTIRGLLWAAVKTGQLLQLVTNEQMRTFAGEYALTAYMAAGQRIISLLVLWPWFAGKSQTRVGITGLEAVQWGIEGWTVWQAMRYPRVEQNMREGEDEGPLLDSEKTL